MSTRSELGFRGRLKGKELLKSFSVEHIHEIDIEAFAADAGLRIRNGGLEGAEGRLARRNGAGGLIRIRAGITDLARRRFIVAHELGHFIMHADLAALCATLDLVRYEAGNAETEANAFAAEVLMPQRLIEPLCHPRQPTLHIIKELSKQFTTTLTATAIRFVDLTEEACALVWSEAGKVKWSIPGKNFYPFVPFGRTLSSYSHAGDAFKGKRLPDDPQEVPASAWGDGRGDLWEHSIHFQKLGAVLTLLWKKL